MEYSLATLMLNVVNDEKLNMEKTILHHGEGVDLIPANIELSAIEVSLVNAMSRELILRSLVDKLREFYDFILIDCMPSLGMMTINALACADSVLIPVQAAYLPVKGLQQLIKTIGRVKKQLNPKLIVRLPCGSASISNTFFPSCASPIPRFTHDTVLPTPPF